MNPVDTYLDELSRSLCAKLPKDVAEARLRESRAHLEEAVRIEGEAAALLAFNALALLLGRVVDGWPRRTTAA